jgi:hypothetical protein
MISLSVLILVVLVCDTLIMSWQKLEYFILGIFLESPISYIFGVTPHLHYFITRYTVSLNIQKDLVIYSVYF